MLFFNANSLRALRLSAEDDMESETLGAVIKVFAALVVGVPLLAFLLQERLIYYPRPLSDAALQDIRLRHPKGQNVFAQAADGTRLHAWHLPGSPDAPLIVYFGGNAEEVSWMLGAASVVPKASWLLVDYRGYGASQGSPSEEALAADALLWYDRFAPQAKKIYVFGRSLGSGVAVRLAAERKVDAAILVTPFDSMVAVGRRHYPYLPVDWLLKHRFDSLSRAPKVAAPLLCLVAMRDSIIPPEHAKLLFDAWAGPKRWVALEGADHNDVDGHPDFWPSINAFLNERSS
jgi:pimeloyl-ACP methyl ester carboxylesterase